MKRFAALIAALMLSAGMAGAQTIPEWMVGDFVGTAGPIDVQLKLVDFNTPWSTPDPTMNHVLFGELAFHGLNGAQLDVSTIALMRCDQPIGCYAYYPRPMLLQQLFPWHPGYNAYLWTDGMSDPLFRALSVDLDSMSAYWATGRFTYRGENLWVINNHALYTLYLVEPLTMPIFPMIPPPLVDLE